MPVLNGGVQGAVAFDLSAMMTSRASTPDATASSPQAEGSRNWWPSVALGLALIVVAHLLDETAWRSLRDARVYERDWGRLLRSFGYLPTWLIVAIGFWTHDRPTSGWKWRGGLVLLAPMVGGAVAEVLKLVFRRLRPDAETFGYAFRAFSDRPFANGGLGMPSSHVLVAFAGATAMARLFPRAWWLWYALAVGCALTRVMANAHFLSDTVVAAVFGWFVGELLSRSMLRRAYG